MFQLANDRFAVGSFLDVMRGRVTLETSGPTDPNPNLTRMPITKAAKKALRQTRRRTIRNLRRKETYRKILTQAQKLLAAGKVGETEKLVPLAYKALDKAVKVGVLKPNAAARRKSRLMAWIKKAKAAL